MAIDTAEIFIKYNNFQKIF